MADFIRVSDWPRLHDTILIAAFSGWNDAADAATTAVRYLGERLSAEPFATIDPEEFYVFTDTRPLTRLTEEGQRDIRWPENQFSYVAEFAGQNRSLVTLVGVEPDLKWRTFSDLFLEVCRKCQVTEVILVGSLLAPVPHTRPVPLTGFSSNPQILEKLRGLGATQSRYEGPTGMVGVLTARSAAANLIYGSLWGAAPSYLSASPNWKVTGRLLEALNSGWNIGLELDGVGGLGLRFEAQVNEAVSAQEDVASFVHDLEEHYDDDDDDDDDSEDASNENLSLRSDRRSPRNDEDNELPSAELLIQELEKQLNLRRDDQPEPG